MLINLSPQRRDDILTISKTGDTLTINGVSYDFSQLPNGATLPREAIDCEWIVSDVNRINGEIELTILLPHGANASHEARFPEPIIKNDDGQVVLPI
jgi:hypothetical protein